MSMKFSFQQKCLQITQSIGDFVNYFLNPVFKVPFFFFPKCSYGTKTLYNDAKVVQVALAYADIVREENLFLEIVK